MVYNPVRASIRTIQPREVKVLHEEDKFNRRVLVSGIRRVANIIRTILMVLQFVNGLFAWENKVHSVLALIVSDTLQYTE